ncbi:hypothetical protein HPB52_016716 [Rhipicephalus sanguineus]|uniref:Uncharacterized protein n=1 Tax=Rhipicephalus sanguineus TaxID=34632 RepID=A0A9D4Q6Q8_RHISA|nr:hypothetical protein HPB52_016716 [Rhipicephalus sanguineus]
MPGIVREHLGPVEMSRLGIDLISEGLAPRQLDTTASKDNLIQCLLPPKSSYDFGSSECFR